MKRGPVLGKALLALAVAIATTAPVARCASPRSQRAESLYRSAKARLATGTIDERRLAITELEEATAIASDDPRYQLALAHAYFLAEKTNLAHGRFERAAALVPGDPEPVIGLGDVAKRDWLSTLAPASLERAIACYDSATRLDARSAEAWAKLAPLLYERGESRHALAAAEQACAGAHVPSTAPLAEAYLSYRNGEIARAESLFAAALPHLPVEMGARFADITPLIPLEQGEALAERSPQEKVEFVRRFWKESDPDPASPENEAQLEFWSRVAHAGLLFADPAHPRWDTRAEMYVRFGPPGSVAYEPHGVPETYIPNTKQRWVEGTATAMTSKGPVSVDAGPRRIGDPNDYPVHSQVWVYPTLGMSVMLNDYALSEHYQLPPNLYRPPDPHPSLGALARGDLLFTGNGRAMFPTVPPGTRVLAAAGQICRFEGDRGARLLAQVEAPGSPVDSVWAICTLMDSTAHEITQLSRTLSPSGCDPTTVRTADFGFDVPPGAYRVNFSLRDQHGGRAVLWRSRVVEPTPDELTLSDVVVTCGPIDIAPGASPVPTESGTGAALRTAAASPPIIRLGPNLRGRVAGVEPLIAYFEIYHLAPAEDGRARFDYEYTVHSEDKDPRPWYKRLNPFVVRLPKVQVRGDDENAGPLRRQFVSVPVSMLPVGHYRLEVRVRDRTNGATALRTVRFERVEREKAGG